MKKLILGLLLACFSASAAITNVDRAEVPLKSILKDSGFETGKAAWAASGGTFLIVTSGSNLLEGSASATWDSSAAAQTLSATSVAIPKGLYGQNGEAFCSIQTPSGAATHLLEVFDGTNVLASVTISSSTAPVRSGVNFVFPTSGNILLRLKSVASNEPLIAVDSCYLGKATNVGMNSVISDWVQYTPTFNGFGTVATSNMLWRRVGDKIEISGSFVAGTTTASEARVSFPAGLTSADTSKIPNLEASGIWASDTTSATTYKPTLVEPSVSYITFGLNNGATAGLGKQNGNSIVTAGTKISVLASAPIAGWSSQGTFNPAMLFTYGAAKNIGGVFTTASASFVDVSDASFNSSRTFYGTSEAPSTANFFGIRVRNLKAGTYRVDVYSPIMHATANQSCYVQIHDGTSGSGFTTIPINGTAARNSINAVSGIFSYASDQADITFRVQMKTSGGACSLGGFDTSNEQNTIYVRPMDLNVNVPILVGGIVTDLVGTGKESWANVDSTCSSSPCAIARQSGDFSSITRSSAGVYVANFTTRSAIPDCHVESKTSGAACSYLSSESASSVTINMFACTSGAATDAAFNIKCGGTK